MCLKMSCKKNCLRVHVKRHVKGTMLIENKYNLVLYHETHFKKCELGGAFTFFFIILSFVAYTSMRFSVSTSYVAVVYFQLSIPVTPCAGLFWSDITESRATMNMNEELNTELHFVLTGARVK